MYVNPGILNRRTEKKIEKAGIHCLVEETLGFCQDSNRACCSALHQGELSIRYMSTMRFPNHFNAKRICLRSMQSQI